MASRLYRWLLAAVSAVRAVAWVAAAAEAANRWPVGSRAGSWLSWLLPGHLFAELGHEFMQIDGQSVLTAVRAVRAVANSLVL